MAHRATEADEPHSLTLVLAAPRTGSTLLCRDVASLGGLGSPREYFRGLEADLRRGPVGESGLVERVAQGIQDDAPGVAALKLMVRQAGPPFRVLTGRRPATPVESTSAVVGWARERFDRVLLVVLVRNAVDQAISQVVADETGVFHSTVPAGGAAAVPPPPDFNDRVMAELQGILRDRRTLHTVAAEHADIALLLTYDDLTRRVEETTERLVAHARAHGFEPRRDIVARRLTKLISEERSAALRESFLDHLRSETGA